jgi:hypothetical protein
MRNKIHGLVLLFQFLRHVSVVYVGAMGAG